MTDRKKLNIALIGLGGMGEQQINLLKSVPFVGEISGVDIRADVCKKINREYGIKVGADPKAVFEDPSVDLVYIMTINSTHVPLAKSALRAGKAVMVEKPMGVTPEDTENLLATAEETGGYLQAGFECRYSKVYTTIKQIIDSGEIGKVRNINLIYSVPPFRDAGEYGYEWRFKSAETGGMFPEKLCHYIDLPRWWIGEKVTKFFCCKTDNVIPRYEIPDNFQCTYFFDDGTVSHLTFMQTSAHEANAGMGSGSKDLSDGLSLGHKLNYVITGTEGAVESDIFQREIRVFHHAGKSSRIHGAWLDRKIGWDADLDHHYFHNTTDQNLDIARRVYEGLPPSISPEDAAETMRLCFEMEQAAIEGKGLVERK